MGTSIMVISTLMEVRKIGGLYVPKQAMVTSNLASKMVISKMLLGA